jgi:plastocyanin
VTARLRRTVGWLVLAAVSACGNSGLASGSGDAVPPPHVPASADGSVRVGLTEWALRSPVTEVPAGEVTFTVLNAGAAPHDLAVEGRAGSWRTPELRTGERTTLTVTAEPGEVLRLWCTLVGHSSSGMVTTLRVAG